MKIACDDSCASDCPDGTYETGKFSMIEDAEENLARQEIQDFFHNIIIPLWDIIVNRSRWSALIDFKRARSV